MWLLVGRLYASALPHPHLHKGSMDWTQQDTGSGEEGMKTEDVEKRKRMCWGIRGKLERGVEAGHKTHSIPVLNAQRIKQNKKKQLTSKGSG